MSTGHRTIGDDDARLSDLPLGVASVIRHVGCDRRVARRLMELGLLPGTRIRVVRRAPMGDPIELRVRGFSLSIRKADAAAVVVEPPK